MNSDDLIHRFSYDLLRPQHQNIFVCYVQGCFLFSIIQIHMKSPRKIFQFSCEIGLIEAIMISDIVVILQCHKTRIRSTQSLV